MAREKHTKNVFGGNFFKHFLQSQLISNQHFANSRAFGLIESLSFTTNLAILLSHFPLFLSVKTITKLNLGQGETFEINLKKISRGGSRSPRTT